MTTIFSSLSLWYMGLVLLVPMPLWWLSWILCCPHKLSWMCGGQVAGHQVSFYLTLLGKRNSTLVLAPQSKTYICLHVLCQVQILSIFFFPEIIVFVSQLPLMMQPCFAAKLFGDFRINIKKERLKKPLKVFSHKQEWQKNQLCCFHNF